MSIDDSSQMAAAYDELKNENAKLRSELESIRSSRGDFWVLFVEASRRLQLSSASIKAAVSSLLNYEIFWDPANQHEFLKTIDTSVDKVGRLVSLFGLAFRAQAGSLVLKPEPHSFQEILAVIQANAVSKHPRLQVKFSLPREGKPVLVDYEYLTIAFDFLFDLFAAGENSGKLQVAAVEDQKFWSLEISGVNDGVLHLIEAGQSQHADLSPAQRFGRLPEHILGLYVACEILRIQAIQTKVIAGSAGEALLHVIVPAYLTTTVDL